jgi:hypothetical protein
MGNVFLGKQGEKHSDEKPQPKDSPKPKTKPISFNYEHCGRDGHLVEFFFRRSVRRCFLGRWQTRTGTTLFVVCLSLVLWLGVRRWCVPFALERGISFLDGVCYHSEIVVGVLGLSMVRLLDVPSIVANTSMGEQSQL